MLIKNKNFIIVHRDCRKEYIRPSSIKAERKRRSKSEFVPIPKKLRSEGSFDFKNMCFYCNKEIPQNYEELEKKNPDYFKKNPIRLASITTKEEVLKHAKKRKDKWGTEVKSRLAPVHDLVAAEAKFHRTCYFNFIKEENKQDTPGRPRTTEVHDAMNQIFQFLEESDDCQFSLTELTEQIKGYVPHVNTIKKELIKKYGNDIFITSNKNKTVTVCFKNVGHKILCDNWYTKSTDEEQEKLKIIVAAAELIKSDIACTLYDNSAYPHSADFFKDIDNDVPDSLKIFLETLIIKNKRSANINATKKNALLLLITLYLQSSPKHLNHLFN